MLIATWKSTLLLIVLTKLIHREGHGYIYYVYTKTTGTICYVLVGANQCENCQKLTGGVSSEAQI